MRLNKQTGYMDMQFTPAVVGIVLMVMALGMLTVSDENPDLNLVKLSIYMLLATAALLFGFAMHIDSLGCPESPFNHHISPLLMTPLCAGPLAYAAYRFYRSGMLPGTILYSVLAITVVATAVGFAVRREPQDPPTD